MRDHMLGSTSANNASVAKDMAKSIANAAPASPETAAKPASSAKPAAPAGKPASADTASKNFRSQAGQRR